MNPIDKEVDDVEAQNLEDKETATYADLLTVRNIAIGSAGVLLVLGSSYAVYNREKLFGSGKKSTSVTTPVENNKPPVTASGTSSTVSTGGSGGQVTPVKPPGGGNPPIDEPPVKPPGGGNPVKPPGGGNPPIDEPPVKPPVKPPVDGPPVKPPVKPPVDGPPVKPPVDGPPVHETPVEPPGDIEDNPPFETEHIVVPVGDKSESHKDKVHRFLSEKHQLLNNNWTYEEFLKKMHDEAKTYSDLSDSISSDEVKDVENADFVTACHLISGELKSLKIDASSSDMGETDSESLSGDSVDSAATEIVTYPEEGLNIIFKKVKADIRKAKSSHLINELNKMYQGKSVIPGATTNKFDDSVNGHVFEFKTADNDISKSEIRNLLDSHSPAIVSIKQDDQNAMIVHLEFKTVLDWIVGSTILNDAFADMVILESTDAIIKSANDKYQIPVKIPRSLNPNDFSEFDVEFDDLPTVFKQIKADLIDHKSLLNLGYKIYYEKLIKDSVEVVNSPPTSQSIVEEQDSVEAVNSPQTYQSIVKDKVTSATTAVAESGEKLWNTFKQLGSSLLSAIVPKKPSEEPNPNMPDIEGGLMENQNDEPTVVPPGGSVLIPSVETGQQNEKRRGMSKRNSKSPVNRFSDLDYRYALNFYGTNSEIDEPTIKLILKGQLRKPVKINIQEKRGRQDVHIEFKSAPELIAGTILLHDYFKNDMVIKDTTDPVFEFNGKKFRIPMKRRLGPNSDQFETKVFEYDSLNNVFEVIKADYEDRKTLKDTHFRIDYDKIISRAKLNKLQAKLKKMQHHYKMFERGNQRGELGVRNRKQADLLRTAIDFLTTKIEAYKLNNNIMENEPYIENNEEAPEENTLEEFEVEDGGSDSDDENGNDQVPPVDGPPLAHSDGGQVPPIAPPGGNLDNTPDETPAGEDDGGSDFDFEDTNFGDDDDSEFEDVDFDDDDNSNFDDDDNSEFDEDNDPNNPNNLQHETFDGDLWEDYKSSRHDSSVSFKAFLEEKLQSAQTEYNFLKDPKAIADFDNEKKRITDEIEKCDKVEKQKTSGTDGNQNDGVIDNQRKNDAANIITNALRKKVAVKKAKEKAAAIRAEKAAVKKAEEEAAATAIRAEEERQRLAAEEEAARAAEEEAAAMKAEDEATAAIRAEEERQRLAAAALNDQSGPTSGVNEKPKVDLCVNVTFSKKNLDDLNQTLSSLGSEFEVKSISKKTATITAKYDTNEDWVKGLVALKDKFGDLQISDLNSKKLNSIKSGKNAKYVIPLKHIDGSKRQFGKFNSFSDALEFIKHDLAETEHEIDYDALFDELTEQDKKRIDNQQVTFKAAANLANAAKKISKPKK